MDNDQSDHLPGTISDEPDNYTLSNTLGSSNKSNNNTDTQQDISTPRADTCQDNDFPPTASALDPSSASPTPAPFKSVFKPARSMKPRGKSFIPGSSASPQPSRRSPYALNRAAGPIQSNAEALAQSKAEEAILTKKKAKLELERRKKEQAAADLEERRRKAIETARKNELLLSKQAEKAKLEKAEEEAEHASLHGEKHSKSKGPVASKFISPRALIYMKRKAKEAREKVKKKAEQGLELTPEEEKVLQEPEKEETPLPTQTDSGKPEVPLTAEQLFVARCIKQCATFVETSPKNVTVIGNLFYPAECSVGPENRYVTGKSTSMIHAPIEIVRSFLENPQCEDSKREHKAMNDNDLNTFPLGLLWMNESKSTRYTQQVFKFTKEVAIQTLCQVVSIEEDEVHESDEEDSDNEEMERDKIVTIGFKSVTEKTLPAFARKFMFNSSHSTVRSIDIVGYYVLKKLDMGCTELTLNMKVHAPETMGLGFLSPTGISTNLNKILSPLPFLKGKGMNSSGPSGFSASPKPKKRSKMSTMIGDKLQTKLSTTATMLKSASPDMVGVKRTLTMGHGKDRKSLVIVQRPGSIYESVDHEAKDVVIEILKKLMLWVSAVWNVFEREVEVDKDRIERFVSHTLNYSPPLDNKEKRLIDSMMPFYDHKVRRKQRWRGMYIKRLSDVRKFKMYKRKDNGREETIPWGMCTARVDTSAKSLLAYISLIDTNERYRNHIKNNGPLPRRAHYNVMGSRSCIYHIGTKFPAGIDNRIFRVWSVWDKRTDAMTGNDLYVLAFTTADQYVFKDSTLAGQRVQNKINYVGEIGKGLIGGITKGAFFVKEVAENVCELTLVQYTNFKGTLPLTFLNMKLSSGLEIVAAAKSRYKRNNAIVDREIREAFVKKMAERGDPDLEDLKMAKDCDRLRKEDAKMMSVANSKLKGIYKNHKNWNSTKGKKGSSLRGSMMVAFGGGSSKNADAGEGDETEELRKASNAEKGLTGTNLSISHSLSTPMARGNKIAAMMTDMGVDHWHTLDSPSPFVKMFYRFTNMDSDDWVSGKKRSAFDPTAKTTIIGKATTEIDADPETVVAFLFGFTGEEQMQNAREEGHVIARVTDNTKNMHSNTIGQLIEYPWNLSNREFISHQTWLTGEDAGLVGSGLLADEHKRHYVWVSESVPEDSKQRVEFHQGDTSSMKLKKTVRAFSTLMCIVEPLWDNDEITGNAGGGSPVNRLSPTSRNFCSRARVTMLSFTDPKGVFPKPFLKATVPQTLNTVITLNKAFQHNKEVDQIERQKCIRLMRDTMFAADGYGTAIDYSADEDESWNDVQNMFKRVSNDKLWLDIKSEDSESRFLNVSVSSNKLMHNSLRFTKVSTIVDADVEEVAALNFLSGNRKHLEDFYKSPNGLEKKVWKLNNWCHVHYYAHHFGNIGLSDREVFCKQIWKRIGKERIEVTQGPCDPDESTPVEDINTGQHMGNRVRAQFYTMSIFEKLEPKLGMIPQTRFTMYSFYDPMGTVPKTFWGKNMQTRPLVEATRAFYDKRVEIDRIKREELKRPLLTPSKLTPDEKKKMQFAKLLTSGFEKKTPQIRVNEHTAPNIDSFIFTEDSNVVWGQSTSRIGASAQEVLAHILDFQSTSNSMHSIHDTIREITAVKSHHTLSVHRRCQIGFNNNYVPLDFVCDMLWQKNSETSYSVALFPTSTKYVTGLVDQGARRATEEDADGHTGEVATASGVVKNMRSTIGHRKSNFDAASFKAPDGQTKSFFVPCRQNAYFQLDAIGENETTLKYVTNIGAIDDSIKPERKAMKALITQTLADTVNGVHEYFLNSTSLDRALNSRKFGKELGENLMYPRLTSDEERKGKKVKLGFLPIWYFSKRMASRTERVQRMMETNMAMKELDERYPWFKHMLTEVCKGDLAMNIPQETRMQCMTEAEAIILGKSLIPSLKSRKMAESGLKQWEMQNRAAQELFDDYPFMEETMLVVSQEVIRTAPWGLMWRVAVGSTLSILDMVTDLNCVIFYLSAAGQAHFGYATIVCIAMSMIGQLGVVYAQHAAEGKTALAKQIPLTLLFLKPGYDAWVVTSGKKEEKHHIVSPLVEMCIGKAIQIICESIPSGILQIFAYISVRGEGKRSSVALFSIFISCITTGYSATQVSHDLDTSAGKRRSNPLFYGFVPDDKSARKTVFGGMIAMSSCMVLLKCVSTSLWLDMNEMSFLIFTACDIVGFILYKWFRNDLKYWIKLDGVGGMVFSIAERSVAKIMCDYTAILQFRSPFELGGQYFAFNTIFQVAVSMVVCIVYINTPMDSDYPDEMPRDANLVMGTMLFGLLVFVCSSYLIYTYMEPKYRDSLTSRETGIEHIARFFERSEDDQIRMDIFKRHKQYLEGIEEEIKVWTHENWDNWLTQDWFTDQVIDRIPEEFIPKKELIKLFQYKENLGFVRETQVESGLVDKLFGHAEIIGMQSTIGYDRGADGLATVGEDEDELEELGGNPDINKMNSTMTAQKKRRRANRQGSISLLGMKGGMW
ncbi:hypothetical protein TL16_g11428 [Triparma laevis f. inornata]|uniref:Uncharacterized protein n=1 Tax=Triparma laevis f. inornata TaxID=1714386 RepID=A0A9W7EQN4_9STRA|nr:hypothetical protein TL16_g11428 [Triparma laevis f. inornata]